MLGIAFDHESWGAELAASFVERKDRLQKPTEDNPTVLFAAPGYSTLDLYSHWQVLPQVQLFGALTNITDRKYWEWGNRRRHSGFLDDRPLHRTRPRDPRRPSRELLTTTRYT